ncbi:AAA family ATPase [Spartinivicinus poritis]|uniref:AAA family ATPase n=1 Tax=Spartinivicinus poritis TaxID=2994640 RepID=A0ABT5UBN5_9GAMM|nr:AAA family ATPase [Spartinivicinus sp. A2-2]MDE1463742.1 AAA family ATPase [Spartinivicinus sp. A2-2]
MAALNPDLNGKLTRGLVLGKFYPPHLGHQYLIAFAAAYVDELTVVVEAMPAEQIPASRRIQWLQSLFVEVKFLLLADYNPQDPSETSDFWQIWQSSILRLLSYPPDVVFASESYGEPLAACLGAEFVPVDPLRQLTPVSGTAIRANPYQYWQYLSDPVKSYYRKRVCICGPESTGKSTLSKWLANQLDTRHPECNSLVPEYARLFLEQQQTEMTAQDIVTIAKGQAASEKALMSRAGPLQIVDTGVIASKVWSEFLFDQCSTTLDSLSRETHYDLYLLCYPDIPWVKDDIRYLPCQGQAFFDRLQQLILESRNAQVEIIKGNWQQRRGIALQAVLQLIE